MAQQQQLDGYAKWTGIMLAVYLSSQWALPILRLAGRQQLGRRLVPLHKQAGAVAPLLFYIHSMKFGYDFMVVLSTVYLANVLVGLLSVDVVKDYVNVNRKTYALLVDDPPRGPVVPHEGADALPRLRGVRL